jgi:hypothetical protein
MCFSLDSVGTFTGTFARTIPLSPGPHFRVNPTAITVIDITSRASRGYEVIRRAYEVSSRGRRLTSLGWDEIPNQTDRLKNFWHNLAT